MAVLNSGRSMAKQKPSMLSADSIMVNTTSKASVIWPKSFSNNPTLPACLTTLLVRWPALLGVGLAATGSTAELRDEWIDSDTGHRVVRLSRVAGQNQSLYFHQNEFTATCDKLVFENSGSDGSRTARGGR